MSLLELAYLYEHGLNVLNSSLDLIFPNQPFNPFNYTGDSSNLNPAPRSGTKFSVKCPSDLFLPIIWTLNILDVLPGLGVSKKLHVPTIKM